MYPSSSVEVISNRGLTKKVYSFKAEGTLLIYSMFMEYNRNSKDEIWPDEWTKALNYEDWCIENNQEEELDGEVYDSDYQSYCDSLNPVCHHTKDNRICASGQCGYGLSKEKPLTDKIRKKAKINFIKNLTVEG